MKESQLIKTLKEINKDLRSIAMNDRIMKCIQESLCFVSLKKLDHAASTFIKHNGVPVGVNNEYIHIKTKKV